VYSVALFNEIIILSLDRTKVQKLHILFFFEMQLMDTSITIVCSMNALILW